MSERDIVERLTVIATTRIDGRTRLVCTDARAEILRLRAKLAEVMAELSRANDAGERAAAAAETLAKKLEEARDEIARLKRTAMPTFASGNNGCVCPAGAEQTCNSPFCGRRSRPYEIT